MILVLFGQPNSGKTTLADEIMKIRYTAIHIDGDKLREIFVNKDFTSFKESMRIYTWKKDKSGISTDETNHEGSDQIDGVRYSLESEMRNKNYKSPFSVESDLF